MNTINPGFAIGAIACSSNNELVTTALGAAALMGNVAGPNSHIAGPLGEAISPAFNLIVAGSNSPHWYHAQRLLLGPVESCQHQFRELASAVTPQRLDHLQSTRHRLDRTNEMLEHHDQYTFSTEGTGDWTRPFVVLRQPTFALRSPSAVIYEASQAEILDASALLYYPDGNFDPSAKIAAAIAGCDSPRTSSGFGRLNLTKAYIFATLTRSDLSAILYHDHQVLRHCLLLDEPRSLNAQSTPAYAQKGYLKYNGAIRQVLSARRKGEGIKLEADAWMYAELEELLGEIRTLLAGLPSGMRYFNHFLSLPYKLLWAFLLLQDTQEPHWCLPMVKLVTTEALERQRALLLSAFEAAAKAREEQVRVAMLRKLVERPCKRRDLFRRYPVQRKELHEPVLRELILKGLVAERPEGFLEVSSAGKAQLI